MIPALTVLAGVQQSSTGPAPHADADIVWKQAKDFFNSGKYSEAVFPLKRVVERYPGYPGFTESHFMLARSHMELHEPQHALKPARYYVSALGKKPAGLRARTLLAEIFLDLRKFNEARFTATEIMVARDKAGKRLAPADLYAESLLLKARAEMGLGRDDNALLAIESAKKEITGLTGDADTVARADWLRGESAWIELTHKTRECSRLPGKKRIDEGTARDRIGRRGDCLLEASLVLRSSYETTANKFADLSTKTMAEAAKSFLHACENPPDPAGSRTRLEIKRYKEELVQILRQDCGTKMDKLREFLTQWKQGASAMTAGRIDTFAKEIGSTQSK